MNDARYQREAEFHDAVFANKSRAVVEKYYAVTHSSSKAFYRNYLESHCRGRRVLEYGCGADSHWKRIATDGGKVTSIDLSSVAVSLNKNDAAVDQARLASFSVMNAELLAFADSSFDLVCGNGILHHLDLELAYRELARVLKPDGSAIFLEPLGHNPVINLYRKLTPRLRTPDEHPLMTRDLEDSRSYFDHQEVAYFHLTSLAAAPLAGKPGFETVASALGQVDSMLFRHVKWLRKHAWASAIVLSAPRKSDHRA